MSKIAVKPMQLTIKAGDSVAYVVHGNQRIVVAVIPFIVMPFIMIGLYGLLGMLLGVTYNFFAPKFGGLELTIKTQEQEVIMQNNQD